MYARQSSIGLGEQGPKQTIRLYRLMYDRLVNHHHLNNLLWVWTTEANDQVCISSEE